METGSAGSQSFGPSVQLPGSLQRHLWRQQRLLLRRLLRRRLLLRIGA